MKSNNVTVLVELPGLERPIFEIADSLLEDLLRRPSVKNRDAICETFLYLLRECPAANPSDLWHHVVYRLYCSGLARHRPQDPDQSWKRASGEALEVVVARWYSPVLAPYGIRIETLLGRTRKKGVLEEMGLGEEVGHSKLDVALYKGGDDQAIFGGVHVKASFAERISDDVPASRSMMRKGYFSPLWTLDVKSFPPPQGNLVNRGELGSPLVPSDKRRYIEGHGEFDNCYSANTRTLPTVEPSASGKLIYTLDMSAQPDKFALDVIGHSGHRQ